LLKHFPGCQCLTRRTRPETWRQSLVSIARKSDANVTHSYPCSLSVRHQPLRQCEQQPGLQRASIGSGTSSPDVERCLGCRRRRRLPRFQTFVGVKLVKLVSFVTDGAAK